MMTLSKRMTYRLFVQTVILLLLYTLAALLGAVQFIDNDFLLHVLPYHQLGAFGNVLLYLTMLTGLISGGVYVIAAERADGMLWNEPLLRYLSWGWTLLLVLA